MQTLIAAFDDKSRAQQAIDSLLQHGFSHNAVHLQSGYAADGDVTASAQHGVDTSAHSQGFFAGVEHFFSNLFGDDDNISDSGKYVDAVRRGNSVVAVDVQSDAEVDKATSLLYDLGAVDVDEQNGTTAGTTAMADGQTVMPVIQEELQVGKRTVQSGGIRVVKRMTETPVSEMVTLREEKAVVERRPVTRDATDADLANFKEGTIELREQSEEAVVGKTAHVVEEVVIGKRTTERTQEVSDTVRRTDVEVEKLAPETTRTTGTTGTKRLDD